MKFGVVIFPGSDCDMDVIHALQDDLGQEVISLWHKDKDLSMFSTEDCIVLPGGFSYGDYLRCGAIARFSPMMQSVSAFAKQGGKVFGICNGFQILCESGLLPGVLLQNANMKFVCKNIFLTDGAGVFKIPVAHGEGRYFARAEDLDEMKKNNQILFSYSNQAGLISPEFSPNGSTSNIAGIRNKQGNVFGMMPHPERACSKALSNTDGRKIFSSLFSIN